ncbi:hypothetical protein FSP39_024684 [Pinctada imbricata]|uniref:EGF-like domain-containing protein n=1 Tax=Pinctada imbricata TaxID=66713 RepID=A0AA89BJV3_PINIB|nr:hypothetical protein FSP39_024684 [Pinctada imbricata]
MTYEYNALGDEFQIGFGVTVIGEKQKGGRTWDALFWARDKYKASQQWFTIENDPSLTLNDFTIQTTMEEMPDSIIWKLNLLLNGEVKATLNGLQFYEPLHAFAYTWNKDDYKPPITDIFEFFKSSAEVSDIRVPIEQDKACLHGTGFYDPDSGIKEIWVGVSDSLNSTDNVAKMTKYKENCVICKQGCDFGCDKKCVPNNFDILPIKLHHLNLESSVFNQTNISQTIDIGNTTTYYMNVKMVNYAGQETTVRSNGIMVDSTPPVCDYMRCTDPTHSIDEQTKYLGSNNTIGAFWSCDEDISQIQKYVLSVGTFKGGNDTFAETSFGIDTKVAFNLSDGTFFQHNKRYYVNLKAINVAGQSSTYSCDMLVQLIPPSINETVAEPMFGGRLSSDQSVYLMEDDENVGVAWSSKVDDTEFYEWSIGTSDENNEILPKIKVGVSKSGNAAIMKGHLWLNNTNMKKSVSEFVPRNWTGQNVDGVKGDSTFRMEPGRCMYETIYAEGAHDLYVSTENNTRTISLKTDGSGSFVKTLNPFNNGAQIAVSMETTGSQGAALFGTLNGTDILGNYGTAASADFTSYIVDPEQTKYQTSRSLRKRLIKYESESFFMSPAPAIEVDSFEVHIEIKSTEYLNNTLPILAVWISDTELDYYDSFFYVLLDTGTIFYSFQICLKTLLSETDSLRKRRSTPTDTTIQSPHMFSLFKASSTYYSSPPIIETDTITMTEDTKLNDYELNWHDNEDDCVQFALKENPKNADANVSLDGQVSVIPYKDFAGNIILTVEAFEVACPGKQALKNGLTTVKNITIIVEEENDEPESALIMADEEVIDTDFNDTVDILLEANSTTHHDIGSFFLVDVDFFDNLTILTRTDVNATEAEFNVREVKSIENLQATGKKNINTAKQVKVDFNISPNFSGIINYTMLGYDREDYISQPLKIQIFSMMSPCVHGKCAQKTNISEPCRSKIRALTFDPFICKCDPGYEGHWCEIETNECRRLPCPLLYDCVDQIAMYACVINPGKLVAILFCVAIGVAVVVFVIRQIKKMKRQNFKLGHLDDDDFFSPSSRYLEKKCVCFFLTL